MDPAPRRARTVAAPHVGHDTDGCERLRARKQMPVVAHLGNSVAVNVVPTLVGVAIAVIG